MNAWARALHAERLKLKHTLALWMVVLMPVGIMLLVVAQFAAIAHFAPGHHVPTPGKIWPAIGKTMFALWCLLMLPLYVTLETALLAGLEHGNHQWKHIEALALPRRAHYLAKWSMAVLMVACAYGILLASVPVAGWILMLVAPGLGLTGMPPLGLWTGPAAASFLASVLMVSLQTWIALRWRSFAVAVSVGVFAMVAGFLIGRSHTWGKFYPWSMPLQAFGDDHRNAIIAISIGLIAGVIVAALGLYDYVRRDTG